VKSVVQIIIGEIIGQIIRGTRMTASARSATRLGRLAHFCSTRRKLVLGLWVLGLIALTVVGQVAFGAAFSNKFGSGNSESIRAQKLLQAHFPTASGDRAQVVISTTAPVTAADNQAAIESLVSSLTGMPHVAAVTSPFSPAARGQISRDGTIAFATVQFDKQSQDLPKQAIKDVIAKAQSAAHAGFAVELGGPPIDLVEFAVPTSEWIGILAAMIILLVAFGSVVAMGMPLIIAIFGVGCGFAVLDILSHTFTTPEFAPQLAAMIGLGVGIDYALFIVTRYRTCLHDGLEPEEAVEIALTTSGRAVMFAGITVVISLLGLLLMGQPFVVGLALGAVATVLFVMLGTVTLLPAMLGFCGKAIDKVRIPGLHHKGTSDARHTMAYRWSRVIQRHPWAAALVSLAILVGLAMPLFSMKQAFTDDGNAATNLTTRKSYDLLAKGFGPGSNGPLVLAVTTASHNEEAATNLGRTIAGDPGVQAVAPARFNESGDTAVMIVIPTTSPQDSRTQDLVQNLRRTVIPAAVRGTDAQVLVGGFTAGGIDSSVELTRRLPWVIGLVVGLSFVLLMAVFRSIAVPVKAAIMNLLSIGAAYGVVVAVFQKGDFGSVIGIGKTGPIDPWVPLFLFTILFGLSMDYEVFLLSRIREEYLRTGDNATAVADGLAATARVITAAAAIMVCVFGSFLINDPIRVLKLFGLGLATAVLVDATLVRMVLVPATMELLGGANWWLPRWLDRLLPKVNVEGEELEILEQPEPASM